MIEEENEEEEDEGQHAMPNRYLYVEHRQTFNKAGNFCNHLILYLCMHGDRNNCNACTHMHLCENLSVHDSTINNTANELTGICLDG